MMNRLRITGILQILILSIIFTGFISCSTTQEVTKTKPNVMYASYVEPTNYVVPKQHSNINVVPAEKPDMTEKEIADRQKKADKLLEQTQNMTEEQKKFYYIKKTGDYEVIGEDLDYKIMVNHEYKEVIIQFEESDSKEDWHNNYLFFPWPLKLDNKVVWTTYGYAKIYKSADNIPIDQFMEQIEKYPDYKVIIWGWSLGSAMAKITARHLTIRTSGDIVIDELTTYGDVKCWYNPFYSVKKNCKRIREYITPNDIIGGCVPTCRRDYTCVVGEKFDLKKSTDCEHYHTHYEDYDYSKFE